MYFAPPRDPRDLAFLTERGIDAARVSRSFFEVKSPFIEQFITTDWKLVTGNLEEPSVIWRKTANPRMNLRDGKPWLDEARISQAVSAPEVAEVRKPRVMHRGVVENLLGHRVQVTPFPTESGT